MAEETVTTQTQVDLPPSLIDVDPPEPAPAADAKKADEPEAPDENAKPPEETTEQQEIKKQSRFQRRLDAQKSARIAAETEAKLLREQNAKLEAQLSPHKQLDAGEPQRDQFDDDVSYLRAVARHEAKQIADASIKQTRDEEQRSKATASQTKIANEWSDREKVFQAATKDYEDVVMPYVEDGLKDLSDGARAIIVESGVGPNVLYHLASNPDVVERISALSPLRQIVEIGKLEDALSAPVAKKSSNAPAPIKPVGQGRTSVNGYNENMSDAEYETFRKSQGARWAR